MDQNSFEIPVLIKELLNVLPVWAVLLCVIVFFIILSLLFYLIIPNFLKPHRDEGNGYPRALATYIGIVGAFYGILFGLVNVNLWQGFHKMQDIISREASDFSSILLNSAVFEPTVYRKIQKAVKTYVDIVRNEEWKKMARGKSSEKAWPALQTLFVVLQSYQPRDSFESIYYSQVISLVNDVVRARRERLDTLQNSIPPPLYRVLVMGSFLLIFFVCLMTIEAGHRRSLVILSILVNILIAFNLYLVIDLGNPFLGRISIKSTPFNEGILTQLDGVK